MAESVDPGLVAEPLKYNFKVDEQNLKAPNKTETDEYFVEVTMPLGRIVKVHNYDFRMPVSERQEEEAARHVRALMEPQCS